MKNQPPGDDQTKSNPLPPDQEPEGEEVPHYDDKTISRAYAWSGVAALLILAVGGGAYYALTRKKEKPAPKITQITAPEHREAPKASPPAVKFTDITAASGIKFSHVNGAYGDKLLPETMGGGVAFLDYDNDGAPDLLFINSTYWPGHVPPGKQSSMLALYHNDGTGKFQDVTAGSGLDIPIYGMGCAVGDFDNDGLVDVYVTAVGGNRLFRNLGHGKFSDVTSAAGVGGSPEDWSTCATWLDYDNDGKLDLFVGNYVRWSREIDFEVGYKLVGLGRAYGQPSNFQGALSCLYHNDGNGRFTDVSATSGVQVKNPSTGVPVAKSLGVAPVDINGDGWIDLIVANDTVQNFVFSNQGNGTFKEIGALSGVAFDSYGATRGAMGIDTGYFRNDGALGIAIGNFANEMTALYVSQGANSTIFTDEAIPEGIGPASRLLLKFGVFFFDYDLDGRLDVLTANGHLEEEIGKIQQSQHYAQPAQLFWNSGNGFVAASAEQAGTDLFKPIVGRGSAFADIDGDGDLDVVLTQIGGPPLLLRNDQQLNNNWVRFKLTGRQVNHDALGARITVRAGGQTLSRQVMPTRSYLSQSELPVTIGLGQGTTVEGVEIVWPDGSKQALPKEAVALRKTILVEQSP